MKRVLSNPLSTAAFWSMLAWLLLWVLTGWAGFTWLVILSAVFVIAGYVLARRARKAGDRQ